MFSDAWVLPVVIIVSSWLLSAMSAWLAYRFARRRELENELRKLKLVQYQAFVLAVSGIVEGRSSIESQCRYSDAFNNMQLVSSGEVLVRLRAFQKEISAANPKRNVEREDELWNSLISSMRADLFGASDNTPNGFNFGKISIP